MGTKTIKATMPRRGTRQAKILNRLISASKRGTWTINITGISRKQLSDDIRRLGSKGWNIQTAIRRGLTAYRLVN